MFKDQNVKMLKWKRHALLINMGKGVYGMEVSVWIIYVKMHLQHILLMNSAKVYTKSVLRMAMVV